jgi:hypothetical protein
MARGKSERQTSGVTVQMTPTRLNFPSKKLLAIFQKLGNEETITSDIIFTISQVACHTS